MADRRPNARHGEPDRSKVNPPTTTKWASLGELVELEGQVGIVVGTSGTNSTDLADTRRYVLLKDGTLRFVGRYKVTTGRTRWRVGKVPEWARLAVATVKGERDYEEHVDDSGRQRFTALYTDETGVPTELGPLRRRGSKKIMRAMKGRSGGARADTWKIPVPKGWLDRLVEESLIKEGRGGYEVDWRLGETIPEDYYARNGIMDDEIRRLERIAKNLSGTPDVEASARLNAALARAGRQLEAYEVTEYSGGWHQSHGGFTTWVYALPGITATFIRFSQPGLNNPSVAELMAERWGPGGRRYNGGAIPLADFTPPGGEEAGIYSDNSQYSIGFTMRALEHGKLKEALAMLARIAQEAPPAADDPSA